MKLQYQLSNGNWTDCGDRTDEFLSLCAKYGGGQEKSLSDLAAGRSVRNDGSDWYSNCRDFEVIEKIQAQHLANQPPIEMVKCSCGHTIPRTSVMSASLGSSCPDCYDDMSN